MKTLRSNCEDYQEFVSDDEEGQLVVTAKNQIKAFEK